MAASDISVLTNRGGRIVAADPRAAGLLNCPPSLLAGAHFAAFVRDPSGAPLRHRLAGLRAPQQWDAAIKPLSRDPLPATVGVRPVRGGSAAGGLHWSVRPRVPTRPAEAPSPARSTPREWSDLVEEAANRIARELHDGAGQYVAAAHLVVDGLCCLVGCPTRRRLPEVKAALDAIEQQLRELAHDLRPPVLEFEGLGPALRRLAADFESRFGLPVHLEDRVQRRLPRPTELHLFRIAQEALANAGRHARPSRLAVRLERRADAIVLEVEDDGVGLAASAGAPRTGLGLLTMAERAAVLQARLSVGAGRGGGTLVRVEVPEEPLACVS